MRTYLLPLTSAAALLGAAATARADVMISNLSQEGLPYGYGPGLSAGTVFSTGPAPCTLNSATLEHWYYDPANPPQHFQVRIYQAQYTPDNPVPTMQWVADLGNPTVDPTPLAGFPGQYALVRYSPLAEVVLEPSTSYALMIGEPLDGAVEAAVMFTSSSNYDAADGWALSGDLGGLDVGTAQYWWPASAHLMFAMDASPAVVANHPPDVSQAHASIAVLWPPDGRLVPFSIEGVTDPDGDPVSITVTGIQQDEPPALAKQGPDAVIYDTGTAAVRATRLGKGNGRVYKVSFTADDGKPGGAVSGAVYISVPHDQAHPVAVDDGPTAGYFNSTAQ
jgi:hypothetical protein